MSHKKKGKTPSSAREKVKAPGAKREKGKVPRHVFAPGFLFTSRNRASHARTKRNDFPVAGGLLKTVSLPPTSDPGAGSAHRNLPLATRAAKFLLCFIRLLMEAYGTSFNCVLADSVCYLHIYIYRERERDIYMYIYVYIGSVYSCATHASVVLLIGASFLG